jgi:NAD(P)H dehydrogenase (quinone)
MFAIIGAAGNVGYATSSALRQAGVPVRAILRDAAKAARLREIGCEIAMADLQDPGSLSQAIGNADAVQIIVPVSPQAKDPAEDLRRSIESVAAALAQARPKRVLAISDYGAHVADDIGMPSIFHDFEARLRRLGGHKQILRSAEHMHNWGRAIPAALASGTLPSFQDPIDMQQPTISAQDLGLISAKLLLRPDSGHDVDVIHAEGPRRYSASDVATAVSQLSGRTVHAQAVPRSQWNEAFGRMPGSLAELLMKANEAKNKGGLVDVEPKVGEVIYGSTELIDALRPLLRSEPVLMADDERKLS